MGVPSGEIVARPLVARACGCLKEFQHYAVDKFRAQRLAKFQQTRCEDCVAKLNEEQRKAAAALPKKGEAFKILPLGTQMTMTRRPDGIWAGTLSAGGKTGEGARDSPHGLTVTPAPPRGATRGGAPPPRAPTPAPTRPPA